MLIAALVLVALLLAADRIGCLVAERIAAGTLQDSQHLEHRPGVHIDGFPFLTQFATGHYDRVRADTSEVVVGDGQRSLRIHDLDVTLQDVRVSRDFSHGTAGSLRASGTFGYADLSAALGVHVRYARGGRLEASAATTVAGVHVSGTVSAVPTVTDQTLRFEQVRISTPAGPVPDSASAALGQVFGAPLSLRGLPYGLRVANVGADADGLVVTLTGTDLAFQR